MTGDPSQRTRKEIQVRPLWILASIAILLTAHGCQAPSPGGQERDDGHIRLTVREIAYGHAGLQIGVRLEPSGLPEGVRVSRSVLWGTLRTDLDLRDADGRRIIVVFPWNVEVNPGFGLVPVLQPHTDLTFTFSSETWLGVVQDRGPLMPVTDGAVLRYRLRSEAWVADDEFENWGDFTQVPLIGEGCVQFAQGASMF